MRIAGGGVGCVRTGGAGGRAGRGAACRVVAGLPGAAAVWIGLAAPTGADAGRGSAGAVGRGVAGGCAGRGPVDAATAAAMAWACLLRSRRAASSCSRRRRPRSAGRAGTTCMPLGTESTAVVDALVVVGRSPCRLAVTSAYVCPPTPSAATMTAMPETNPPNEASVIAFRASRTSNSTAARTSPDDISATTQSAPSETAPRGMSASRLTGATPSAPLRSGDRLAWVTVIVLRVRMSVHVRKGWPDGPWVIGTDPDRTHPERSAPAHGALAAGYPP